MMMYISASNNKNRLLVAGTAAAAGCCALTILWWRKHQQRQKQQDGRSPPLRRNNNMSFTSAYLAMGTYPDKAKFAEPIINCALYFKPGQLPTDDEIVKGAVIPLIEKFDRLALIPVQNKAGDLRPPNPKLDPTKLVRRIKVNAPTPKELYRIIETQVFPHLLGNNPQREDLPWWEFLVLENTAAAGDQSSIILWRIHHALGDGISLATVACRAGIITSLDGRLLTTAQAFMPTNLMRKKSSLLEDGYTRTSWWQRWCQFWNAVSTVFLLPTTSFDHPTIFSKASVQPDLVHNGIREIVILPTIPLDFIKAIKDAANNSHNTEEIDTSVANITVNDILFTILSQAIHDYLLAEKCPVLAELGAKLQCRGLLATALPRNHLEQIPNNELMKNQFFLLSSEMFVGCADILTRLQHLHNNFQRLKQSPLAYIGIRIQNTLLKYLPLQLNRAGVYDAMVRHSMTVSNVPGPKQPVLFAAGKKRIEGVHMFFSNLCPQFGIVSYAGRVYGNLTIDPKSVPNCQSLAKFYHQALVKLANRLHVSIPPEMMMMLTTKS